MKQHRNIGAIGHIDHGKTTLTAAITSMLADQGNTTEPISDEPQEKGITINTKRVEYKSPSSACSFDGWYIVWREIDGKVNHVVHHNHHGEIPVAAYPTKHLAQTNPRTLPTDHIRRND